jgi:hypothetical protein
LNGIFLLIIIFFVIVPLIKKFKESMDESNTKNRNRYGGYNNGTRYGGYNNPNAHSSHNSKKITYDWKPDYDSQSSQGIQDSKAAKPVVRTPSGQIVSSGTAPAAANTPSPSEAAKTQPSTMPTAAKPESAAISGNKPASAGEVPNEERDRRLNDAGDVTEVHVSDMFMKQDASMHEYDYFGYGEASYDMPESGAFKFSDVTVDSEVRVDAVMPDVRDIVKTEMKD